MRLPVEPPLLPMLAKSVATIPPTGHIEPKFDGFRAIIFKDGDEVEIASRNTRSLTRYFPEIVASLRKCLPQRCVLDGEIIVALGSRLDFEALQQRIHPAASRVRRLSEETPAVFVAFDLLASGNKSLLDTPFATRREQLQRVIPVDGAGVLLAPATSELDVGVRWLDEFEGAGLDGVVAKPLDAVYTPDKRSMFKVKHARTADCVVAGFRWHKTGGVVGSLLLGLYDVEGNLRHVGVAASFTMRRRRELVHELEPFLLQKGKPHPWTAPGSDQTQGSQPGEASRWSQGKDMSWNPLTPDLVVEVGYDHMEGDRFRHTAQFRRWRPDRDASSCNYSQLETPFDYDVSKILGLRTR